jgi:hypothetical protein
MSNVRRQGFRENHDAVMGIDLNNVHRHEVDAAQSMLKHLDALAGPAYVAFLHFYHMDTANACMHVADVRFSPLTFRLAEALQDVTLDSGEIEEVLAHRGRYEEDPGR